MSVFPPLGPRSLNASPDDPFDSSPLYLDGWDLATLGGIPIPGISTVTGGKIRLKFDKKNKSGANGAKPTFAGLDPQEFGLEVTIWTQDQLDALYGVCRQLVPSWQQGATVKAAMGQGKPILLDHPDIRHLGRIDVVVIGATPFKMASGIPRGRSMAFELLHWQAPAAASKSAVVTPKAATSSVPNKRAEAAKPPNPPPMSLPDAGAPPVLQSLP